VHRRRRFRRPFSGGNCSITFGKGLEFFGLLVDKGLIVPAVFQDDMHDAVEQGYIGAHPVVDMQVGDFRNMYLARIGDDDFGPVLLGAKDPGGDQGMGDGGVGADDENAVGLLELLDGVGHRPTSECCGKTCHGGAVSESGAVIDVVGADCRPGEFLQQVVLLVGHLGRGQKGDRCRGRRPV
jgi:hypothetical protein